MTGDPLFQLSRLRKQRECGYMRLCLLHLVPATALMSCAMSLVLWSVMAAHPPYRPDLFALIRVRVSSWARPTSRPVNGLRCPSTNTFIHALLSPLKGLRCIETQRLCSLLDVWDSLVLSYHCTQLYRIDVMCWCHLSAHTIL